MSSKAGKRLVPALRFPEFRDAEGWREVELAKVISLEYGNPLPESARAGGSFPVIGSNGIVGFHDFAITKGPAIIVGRKGSAGQVNWIDSDCFPIDTTFFVRNLVPENFLMRFIFLLLGSCNLEKLKDDGAVPGINRNSVYGLRPFSPNPPEQQKIADCLSSLDDLITVQAKKIEALKAHKKGLIQQLFPAEGETVPRLRFPEFRGAEAWQQKYLGKIGESLDNKRIPITETDRKKGNVPYYGASGVVDFVDGFIFDEDLLCISEDGANLVARTTPIAFSISGKSWVNNHAHVIRFEDQSTQTVVQNYLNYSDLTDYLTGMAQPKLNKAMLDSIPIPLPSPAELEKVADSLSSLDKFINAQTQKLEALKTHKKGLMQGLFPSISEADE